MTCISQDDRGSGEPAEVSGPRRLLNSVVAVFQRSWLIELFVIVGLFVAYNVVRGSSGSDAAAAVRHAADIYRAEGWVFPHLERFLNDWVTDVPVVAVPFCYFYALMHYAATPGILLLSRRVGGWYYWRGYWTLILASAFALVVYALYPVAPPRLMPGLGIVDVMRQFDGYGWWGGAASAPTGVGDATNQYAAMPSMHFGWALWCAIQMWGLSGHRLWRLLAVVYPSLLFVVVLATGNHFLLDVLGGAACILAARAAVSFLGRRFRRTPTALATTGASAQPG